MVYNPWYIPGLHIQSISHQYALFFRGVRVVIVFSTLNDNHLLFVFVRFVWDTTRKVDEEKEATRANTELKRQRDQVNNREDKSP